MKNSHDYAHEIEEKIMTGEIVNPQEMEVWLNSGSLNTLGAAIALIEDANNLLIESPKMDTKINLYLDYFRRCILENPSTPYTENRYIAAHSLSNFYRALRADSKVPRSYLEDFRNMIKHLYLTGSHEVRNALLTGTLEHLFEDHGIRKEFSDWKNVDALKSVYLKALEWSDE
jgi:hypothetical protein